MLLLIVATILFTFWFSAPDVPPASPVTPCSKRAALTKRYGGLLALDKVSFQLQRGEIVGYLGPNGSGKSTTVNIVVGLLEPSAGDDRARRPDARRGSDRYKRRIGYVPEEPYLYTHLTATEYLTLVGRLRGMTDAVLEDKIARLLQLFQLHDSRYSTMAAFSKGMRQRVLLAAALMHNPDLLVLDEPFSGLDVNAGLLFRALLTLLAADGRMILFSTHRFDMVEKLCSRVVILSSGRLVAERESRRSAPAARRRWRRRSYRDAAAGLHAGRARDHRDHRPAMNVLVRHFFCGLFDFGLFSQAGSDAFKRVLIGIIAVMLTFGLFLARVLMSAIDHPDTVSLTPAPYRAALETFVIAFPMLIVAFTTVLVSHSLFPDETDFRVLLILPVSKRVVFLSKLAALTLFAGIFIAAAHIAMLPLFMIISGGRLVHESFPVRIAAHLAASLSGSALVVLALTAINGAVLVVVPRHHLQAASTAVRSAMLCVLVLCVPLVARLPATAPLLAAGSRSLYLVPPVWFLGVDELLLGHGSPYFGRLAEIAAATAAVSLTVAVGSYLFLYRRFDRIMLRPASASTGSRWWNRPLFERADDRRTPPQSAPSRV